MMKSGEQAIYVTRNIIYVTRNITNHTLYTGEFSEHYMWQISSKYLYIMFLKSSFAIFHFVSYVILVHLYNIVERQVIYE